MSYDDILILGLDKFIGPCGLISFHTILLEILNEPFLCCHEQIKKQLEALSRVNVAIQPKEKKGEFCALMYEDTCQKKKEETNFL